MWPPAWFQKGTSRQPLGNKDSGGLWGFQAHSGTRPQFILQPEALMHVHSGAPGGPTLDLSHT